MASESSGSASRVASAALPGGSGDGEHVAAFVLDAATRLHGSRAFVGRRADPIASSGPRAPGCAIDVLATRGVRGLTENARRAVLGLHSGTHRAVVAERPFAPREILALSAGGQRCVSLLPEGSPLGPYATPFAFAAHDLEHLAQLFDPVHHEGQIGFFRRLSAGLSSGLGGLVASHDEAFERDVETVGADTNGSCVFAFASLVMKLKMASRRSLGQRTGNVRTRGPLAADEETAFAPDLARLVDALGMPAALLPVAAQVGRRDDRDAGRAGRAVLAFFESAARDP